MSANSRPGGGSPRKKAIGALALAISAGAIAMFFLSYLLRKSPVPGGAPASPPTLWRAPDFSLVSEQGKTVTLKDYAGTVWIADFIFVQCGGSCPAMTSRMSALTRTLRDTGVRFLSFDVDPDRDGVAELAAYAKSAGADPARWSFLRGEKPVIRALSRDGFKLAVEDGDAKDPEPVLHSTRFVLVDANGTIRGTYDSLDANRMSALVSDARRLAGDAKGAAQESK
jgi:cytochrome oxidase Cu insertion factor (SCO1/SenC/PrrC family)